MNPKNATLLASAAALVFASATLAGCVGAGAKGTLTVCVQSDSNAGFSSVFVTISQVEVKRSGEAGRATQAATTGTAGAASPNATPTTTTTTTTTGTTPGTTGNQTHQTPTAPGPSCVDIEETLPPFGNNTTSPTTTALGTTTTTATTSPTETGQEAVEETGEEDRDEWISIETGERAIDLANFSGPERALLGREEVPEGSYGQVRLTIDRASAVRADGSPVDVKVPSGKLRLVGGFNVLAGQDTVVTLVFDLDRGLVEAGQSGHAILKPVIRVESEVVSETAGALAANETPGTTSPWAPTTRPTGATPPTY